MKDGWKLVYTWIGHMIEHLLDGEVCSGEGYLADPGLPVHPQPQLKHVIRNMEQCFLPWNKNPPFDVW